MSNAAARAITVVCIIAWLALIAFAIAQEIRQTAHIVDLESRNEALSKLCGAAVVVPCDRGETGSRCQARMGEEYEVIYYPRADVHLAELKSRTDLGRPEVP